MRQSELWIKLDLFEQGFGKPELIEQRSVFYSADARSATGERGEEPYFNSFFIGAESERKWTFSRVTARLRCGQQIDVAHFGIVRLNEPPSGEIGHSDPEPIAKGWMRSTIRLQFA